MHKIKKSNELLWLLGTVFVALGVALCSKADLGVSMIAAPAFVLSEALAPLCSFFSVGVTEYVFQGVLLLLLCLLLRRFNWRYLLAFAVAVLYGYTLNLFLWLFGGLSVDSALLRWVLLLVGDCITAIGVACFFRTYMPLQVYELFVAEVARCFKLPIGRVKWCFDVSLLAISAVLAFSLFGDAASFDWSTIWSSSFHSIGLGTLVTTAINSPLITLAGKLLDRCFEPTPLFPKLEKLLKRA
ncbi:MAG: hypothetical protein IJ012_02510 [Clostridia bacterium]|nr:hypothetical protein [Clostridia bacterium]